MTARLVNDIPKKEFETKVVEIRRVARVVAGGKRMRFRALVVVGNRNGQVGFALKKGVDVSEAVSKATTAAKKNLLNVSLKDGTIPHLIIVKYKAAKVLLKPAKPGSGIIAGGPVRTVLRLVGLQNVTSKMLGSTNKINNLKATFEALKKFSHDDAQSFKPQAEN